jgi:hypothetical protein
MCSGVARCLKPGGRFDIENYFLGVETHQEALHAAGFHDIRWHPPLLSPEGKKAYGRNYWSDLLDHPPVIFIECFKQAGGGTG